MTTLALFPSREERDLCFRALDLAAGLPACGVLNCPRYRPPTAYIVMMGKRRAASPPCEDVTTCRFVTEHLTLRLDSSDGRYGIELFPDVRALGGTVVEVDGTEVTIPEEWDEFQVPPPPNPGEPPLDPPPATWTLVPD